MYMLHHTCTCYMYMLHVTCCMVGGRACSSRFRQSVLTYALLLVPQQRSSAQSFAAKSARGGSSADRSLGMALRQPMLLRALLVPACFAQASRTDSIDVLSPGGGCPTTTLRECSGHGQCDRTTRAHYDFCRCDRGYSGSACDRPDFLYACPSNCSYPRGVCSGVLPWHQCTMHRMRQCTMKGM